jgi:homospermidine synthase
VTRPNRVLFLGCGSVTQAALPLLIRDVKVAPSAITIIDFVDNRHRVADALAAGVTYKQMQITPDNLAQVLSDHVSAGDMLLDLAWNIDAPTIIGWCHDNGVRYLNTSVELWDPYEDLASTPPLRTKTSPRLHRSSARCTFVTSHWQPWCAAGAETRAPLPWWNTARTRDWCRTS